jgi:hypothetical protein
MHTINTCFLLLLLVTGCGEGEPGKDVSIAVAPEFTTTSLDS